MASAIDASKPVAGSPTTASVRDNFATAASEITALQSATGGITGMTAGQIPIAATATSVTSSIPQSTFLTPATAASTYLPLTGGTLSGGLTVNGQIVSQGASASYSFIDRTSSRNWQWYGTGDTANLFNGSGNAVSVSASGVVTVGGLAGTATNNNATAGSVGEVISSVVATPAGITNNVTGDITSIALSPGDWDVQGEVWIVNATTVVQASCGINTTSATLIGAPGMGGARSGTPGSGNQAVILPVGPVRLSLAVPATAYLSQQCGVTGSAQAMGKIWARRAR